MTEHAPIRWLTSADAAAGELVFAGVSLVLVGGCPGAGKSTLLDRCDTGAARLLIADEFRAREQVARGLDADAYERSCIPAARAAFFAQLHDALRAGANVIVDAALVKDRAQRELVEAAAGRPHRVHLVMLDATVQECLDGVAGRRRSVPETDVRAYADQWQAMRAGFEHGRIVAGLSSVTVLSRDAARALRAIRFADA